VLVAQITDCHVRCDDGAFSSLADTSTTLAAVVEHLNGLDPGPDVVLATGDLTDNGTPEQYACFREIVEPLTAPLLPFPGNHDHGPDFREAFADLIPADVADGHCSYVVEDHPIRLVGLDNSIPGRHDGRFDAVRESWLNDVLAAGPDRPTLVFTHFPPFETGLRFMDDAGLLDADRLRSVIQQSPQVRLLVTGHLHRPIHTTIGSTLVSTCPSTGNQIGLDLHPERGTAVDEPPAYQLHRWDGERFVTHTGLVRDPTSVRTINLDGFVAEIQRRIEAGEPFAKD